MPDQPVDPLEALAAAEAADSGAPSEPAGAVQAQAAPEADTDEPTTDAQPAPAPWEEAGFKSPEAVYQSYQEMQRKFRERDDELGQLRQFQREATPYLQQVAQQQQMSGQQHQQPQVMPDGVTPVYDQATLRQAVEEGQLSDFDAMAIYADQQAELRAAAMVEHIVSQRLAPLEATAVDRGARDTLDALNAELGDDVVARHADLIGRLITDDRAHYADPRHGTRRLAESIKAAEWDYQHGAVTPQAQPRAENGQFQAADTYVEGGSSAQPPQAAGGTPMDPEEQAIVESLNSGFARPVDEMGIPLPGR